MFYFLAVTHFTLTAVCSFCALWEEITWLKAILCFPFSSSPCLRLQRFSSSPRTRNGLFCPQLTVTVLQLHLLQSPLSETVLWAEEEGDAAAWGIVFKRHLALSCSASIKFTSKYLWRLLAAQAVLVIMLSDVCAGSDLFKPRKVISASYYWSV